jgi:uncharacterized protein YndB with AHSA1/START domain
MEDTKKELTLERTYDAPIAMVWKAWTDPEMVAQWWGPRGMTNPTCEWEAKVGGNIHIVMLAGEELGQMKGMEFPMTGSFTEIDKPKKLVFISNALRDGKPMLENLVTVTFEEQEGKTKMTAHIVVTKATPEAEMALQGMDMGWDQQMDKLGEFLIKR